MDMNVRTDSERSPQGVTPGVHVVPTQPIPIPVPARFLRRYIYCPHLFSRLMAPC